MSQPAAVPSQKLPSAWPSADGAILAAACARGATAARDSARRAAKGSAPAAPSNLIGFERGLRSVWANGAGSADDLAAYLAHLPRGSAPLAGFVGEGLSEELIVAIVMATQRAACTLRMHSGVAQSKPPAQRGSLASRCWQRRYE